MAGPVELTIDDGAVKTALAAQLLALVSQEQRDSIITQAVHSLMEPRKEYGRVVEEAPLVAAFQRAIQNLAREVVAEYIETPDVKARIRAQLHATAEQVFADREWTTGPIIDAVATGVKQILTTQER